MSDLANKLSERSKRDNEIIVGSEIRAALQEQRQEIERLTAENTRLREFILNEASCPEANGFEGPTTFPDCGKCVYCELCGF